MISRDLGGDRLGSGNKNKVQMRTFERSTHDLSYTWRSTMASGTLVPFMSEVGLPGDSFEIKLNADVMTHPTIGPMFGSYKLQLDVFEVPYRLYIASLHMNKLEVGLNMGKIGIPQVRLQGSSPKEQVNIDNYQVNQSCIMKYLGVSGLGIYPIGGGDPDRVVRRDFNAVPFLAYWDIYKNYYANKQEEVGVVIHNNLEGTDAVVSQCDLYWGGTVSIIPEVAPSATLVYLNEPGQEVWSMFQFTTLTDEFDVDRITMNFTFTNGENVNYTLDDLFSTFNWDIANNILRCRGFLNPMNLPTNVAIQVNQFSINTELRIWGDISPKLKTFSLSNIDYMRELILKQPAGSTFIVGTSIPEVGALEPYNLVLGQDYDAGRDVPYYWNVQSSQEGLAIKTYQSDLFNNWISTEWIDGANGINEITSVKVDPTTDSFKIDDLLLSKKIYDMLNRVALSGGSYEDWIDVTYTHQARRRTESPVYRGGLSQELVFQEVVSNSSSGTQPLGTLAGKGGLVGKEKGGYLDIKIDEPSVIMGLVSLTPRIDYSQGNKWDTNLKTIDDLHKPGLDEIGFQELITDQMAWFDTSLDMTGTGGIGAGEPVFRSAGKQPAWINYMTNVNKCYGNFADETQQMWMTLNRRYESDFTDETSQYKIKDLTTYVDPKKYNHIFADTRLDAQNFWTQIRVDVKARRKMSGKVIPNL